MRPNSSTSAPAMNPFGLPERMTSPFGGSDWSRSSASLSSASAAVDSVFAVAPALSNVSHASSSASRESVQCSIRFAAPRRSYAFDEHRAALPAADADRGNAAPPARPLENVQQMQHDARARRAHRMPERDRAAIDVELVLVERTERSRQAELIATKRFVLPGTQARDDLRG